MRSVILYICNSVYQYVATFYQSKNNNYYMAYINMMKRFLENRDKPGSHPGLKWGPLTYDDFRSRQ